MFRSSKKENLAVSLRSRARTAKKCTKKRAARAKLLFCLTKYCFYDILLAVIDVVGKNPYNDKNDESKMLWRTENTNLPLEMRDGVTAVRYFAV